MDNEELKHWVGDLPLLLLSIAECYPPIGSELVTNLDTLKSELPSKISHAKEILSEHDLHDSDVIVIALLLEYLLDGKASVSATDVAGRVSANKVDRYQHLQAARELQQKGILSIESKGVKVPAGGSPQKYLLTLKMLVQSELQLCTCFLDEVFGSSTSATRSDLPYATNQDYLDDWFSYVDALQKLRCCKDCEIDGMDRSGLQDFARRTLLTIERRSVANEIKCPLD